MSRWKDEYREHFKDVPIEECVESFLHSGLDCSAVITTDAQGGNASIPLRRLRIDGNKLVWADDDPTGGRAIILSGSDGPADPKSSR